MKEYVVLTISNNTLIFNYRTINNDEKVFVNKNSLYKDSLYYTFKKYKKNFKNISKTIENIDKTNSIKTIQIMKLMTFKYIIPYIEKFNIENIVLSFSSTLDINDYGLFLNTNIKNIYCYYMPSEILMYLKQ